MPKLPPAPVVIASDPRPLKHPHGTFRSVLSSGLGKQLVSGLPWPAAPPTTAQLRLAQEQIEFDLDDLSVAHHQSLGASAKYAEDDLRIQWHDAVERALLTATQLLLQDESDGAFHLLQLVENFTTKEFEQYFPESIEFRAIALHVEAYYYRKRNKLNAALINTDKAMAVETMSKSSREPGYGWFHLGIIHSLMGQHDEALLMYETASRYYIEQELEMKCNRAEGEEGEVQPLDEKVAEYFSSMLAITYHNCATSLHWLGTDPPKAMHYHEKARLQGSTLAQDSPLVQKVLVGAVEGEAYTKSRQERNDRIAAEKAARGGGNFNEMKTTTENSEAFLPAISNRPVSNVPSSTVPSIPPRTPLGDSTCSLNTSFRDDNMVPVRPSTAPDKKAVGLPQRPQSRQLKAKGDLKLQTWVDTESFRSVASFASAKEPGKIPVARRASALAAVPSSIGIIKRLGGTFSSAKEVHHLMMVVHDQEPNTSAEAKRGMLAKVFKEAMQKSNSAGSPRSKRAAMSQMLKIHGTKSPFQHYDVDGESYPLARVIDENKRSRVMMKQFKMVADEIEAGKKILALWRDYQMLLRPFRRLRKRRINWGAFIVQRWYRQVKADRKVTEVMYSRAKMLARVLAWSYRRQYKITLKTYAYLNRFLRMAMSQKRVWKYMVPSAKKIQATVRGSVHRNLHLKRIAAGRKIAATIKAWIRRNHDGDLYQPAVTIQKCVRGMIARGELRKKDRSARIIASAYTAHKEREFMAELNTHMSKFQGYFFRYTTLQELKFRNMKASIIQAGMRGWKVRKMLRRTRTSMLRLQAHVRRRLTQKQVADMNVKAIVVQQYIRGFIAQRRVQRLNFLGTTLQRWLKRNWAKQSIGTDKDACAARIQAWWAVVRVKKHFWRWVQAQLPSSEVIQTRWRGYAVRNMIDKWDAAQKVIARRWRTYTTQKRTSFFLYAIKMLTNLAKGLIFRRRYLRFRESVLKIQCWWRMKRQQVRLKRQREAARIIQTFMRCELMQLRYETVVKSAIRTIQSWGKCWAQRIRYLRVRSAVESIQMAYRQHLARKRVTKMNEAATSIQQFFRCRGYKQIALGHEVKKKVLISRIDHFLLEMQQRFEKLNREFQEKQDALRNGKWAMDYIFKLAAFEFDEEWGETYRTDCRSVADRNSESIIRRAIQRINGPKYMFCLDIMYDISDGAVQRYLEPQAAGVIQRHLRKMIAMRRVRKKLQAIHKIQNHTRVFLAKDKADRLRSSNYVSKRIVDDVWRDAVKRAALHRLDRLNLKIKCATRIQARFRGMQGRARVRLARQNLERFNECAAQIQRAWRCHVARQYLGLLKYQKGRAIAIQRLYRGHQARVKYEEAKAERKKKTISATKIQSTFRGHISRKRTKPLFDDLSERKKCATNIQRVYRGHQGRKKAAAKQVEVMRARCATQITRIWRGMMGRRYARRMKKIIEEKHRMARIIQAYMRKWLVYNRIRKMARAAFVIQTAWHGCKGRMRYRYYRKMRRCANETTDDVLEKVFDMMSTRIMKAREGKVISKELITEFIERAICLTDPSYRRRRKRLNNMYQRGLGTSAMPELKGVKFDISIDEGELSSEDELEEWELELMKEEEMEEPLENEQPESGISRTESKISIGRAESRTSIVSRDSSQSAKEALKKARRRSQSLSTIANIGQPASAQKENHKSASNLLRQDERSESPAAVRTENSQEEAKSPAQVLAEQPPDYTKRFDTVERGAWEDELDLRNLDPMQRRRSDLAFEDLAERSWEGMAERSWEEELDAKSRPVSPEMPATSLLSNVSKPIRYGVDGSETPVEEIKRRPPRRQVLRMLYKKRGVHKW